MEYKWKMHFGPLNTVQNTVIYELKNNKNKTPASEFRMSKIMFFHRKKSEAINMGLTLYVDYSVQMHTA